MQFDGNVAKLQRPFSNCVLRGALDQYDLLSETELLVIIWYYYLVQGVIRIAVVLVTHALNDASAKSVYEIWKLVSLIFPRVWMISWSY